MNEMRTPPWYFRRASPFAVPSLLVALLCVPAYLFWDSLTTYRLHSDDFAYLAASRSFSRTLSNLFVPHNTHIVPSWRLLTWCTSASAGSLAGLQSVLAVASYTILVLVMGLVGRIAARETRSTTCGLVAMAAVGITSLEKTSSTWYSAGQTLWASFGVLMMLLCLQSWRSVGGVWRLGASAFWAWLAGGMWTIGHIAGPAGAVYLWFDGRPGSRRAASIPLAATILSVLLSLGLGAKKIDATISFHGRTSREAFDAKNGVSHTLQAIPENLILGNLGLVSAMEPIQGIAIAVALFAGWSYTLRKTWSPAPLEAAGGVIVIGAYLVEWSFRGYLPFSSLRGIVPWYDTIPHVGAVLFVVGFWGRLHESDKAWSHSTWGELLGVIALVIGLVTIHQPRITAVLIADSPKMSKEEAEVYLITPLQRLRAVILAEEFAHWQKLHLARLDQAEAVARKAGIGRKLIHETFGRVLAPELPKEYDAAAMLDLPWEGTQLDPEVARTRLAGYFVMEPEPTLPVPVSIRSKKPDPGVKSP